RRDPGAPGRRGAGGRAGLGQHLVPARPAHPVRRGPRLRHRPGGWPALAGLLLRAHQRVRGAVVSVAAAVAQLQDAWRTKMPCPPLRERLLPPGDVATAYEVQAEQVRQWVADGRRVVGAKIGLTSAAVQRQLGVSEPDFGVLLADAEVPDGGEVPAGALLQPRVEAEVAFVLGADLTHPDVTTVDVLRATDHLLACIEIADSRITGWDISIVDTVADNASSGLFVLGTRPRPVAAVDLRLCGMVIAHAGERGRRRRPGQPGERGGMAGPHPGAGRAAAARRRPGPVRGARPDGAGHPRGHLRGAHLRAGVGTGELRQGAAVNGPGAAVNGPP